MHFFFCFLWHFERVLEMSSLVIGVKNDYTNTYKLATGLKSVSIGNLSHRV